MWALPSGGRYCARTKPLNRSGLRVLFETAGLVRLMTAAGELPRASVACDVSPNKNKPFGGMTRFWRLVACLCGFFRLWRIVSHRSGFLPRCVITLIILDLLDKRVMVVFFV